MIAPMPSSVTKLVESLDLSIASKYPVPEMGPLLADSVLAGGKRLRPTLCYLFGGIFNLDLAKLAPFARVAEFVHGASLAHDDVLDMAEMRRDRPTINALSTNSKAILSGDFLIARVIGELSDIGAHAPLRDLADVMEHLVYGEWLQEGSRRQVDVPGERLRQIAEFKTASLIGWCCMVPARIRNENPELVETCRQLGVSLGIAFQMIDDVIDYDTDGEKEYARDLKNGFMNFVTWELLQKNPHLAGDVQSFLDGKAIPSEDWNRAEVDAAKARVRERSCSELDACKDRLQKIVDQVLGDRQRDNACAQSLLTLIDLMSVRDV